MIFLSPKNTNDLWSFVKLVGNTNTLDFAMNLWVWEKPCLRSIIAVGILHCTTLFYTSPVVKTTKIEENIDSLH